MAAPLNLNQLGKHKNAALAAGLAVVAFLVLRARSASAAASTPASSAIDPATGLPYADAGVYSSGGASSGGVDATALAASLEGISSGLDTLNTSLAQVDADVQATGDATAQAIQQQNEASIAAGEAITGAPLTLVPSRNPLAALSISDIQKIGAQGSPYLPSPYDDATTAELAHAFGSLTPAQLVALGFGPGWEGPPPAAPPPAAPKVVEKAKAIISAPAPATTKAAAVAAAVIPVHATTAPAPTIVPTIIAAPRIGRTAG